MKIVIPTHNRVNKQVTLNSIPAAIRNGVLLVTSTTEDKRALQKLHPDNEVIKAKSEDIATKRHWIMKNIKSDHILMLDDDMYFFGRCPVKYREYTNGRWKLGIKHKANGQKMLAVKYASDNKLINLFKGISERLKHHAAVGISSRMGNDCVERDWKMNGRMMHAIAFDREVYLKEKLNFGQTRCREDFNIVLHLLRRGYRNVVCYNICVGPGSYNAPGGASGERTTEQSDSEAIKLAGIHPGFVKVVDKEYNNQPRKEVIVYWKKAYEPCRK